MKDSLLPQQHHRQPDESVATNELRANGKVLQDNRHQNQSISHRKSRPLQRNNTGLPDNLKSGMENLSGVNLDQVKVHYNSTKPASIQAHAFAQGTDIHLAKGQEKHLPHELGHVVQQAQGRVKPTASVAGMAVNDNASLEREADSLGARALSSSIQRVENRTISNPTTWQAAVSNKSNSDLSKAPMQRYLIIGNTDYTRELKDNAGDIDGLTDQVYNAMEAALDQTDDYENEVYLFIHANTGGLVKRQIKKWIEDNQGEGLPHSSNPTFGRKQQGRSYANYVDAAKAIYGWVSAKPGRRREKALANQVYQSPVIEAQIDSLLNKLALWIHGKGNSAAIETELDRDNPVDANWADYQRWFNRIRVADGRQIPGRFLPVLQHPQNYNMRDKIATLHDVMKYFMGTSVTAGAGELDETPFAGFQATTQGGRQNYHRPTSSILRRNAMTKERVGANLPAERLAGRVRDSNEESHATFEYARRNQIPMWARHSYTAARMMRLGQQAGADHGEISAVAWSIMAFWRKDYDHRSIPYHTLHEIMDFTPAFGLNYDPQAPGAGLEQHDIEPRLLDAIYAKASLAGWSARKSHLFRSRPKGVGKMRDEIRSSHTNSAKLVAIRGFAHSRTGPAQDRHADTRRFYQTLDNIPANVGLYSLATTARATKVTIAGELLQVLNQIKAFAFT